MNIAYSTDENYAKHAYISINSLLDSNSEEECIMFYILDNRISDPTKKAFHYLVKEYDTEKTKRQIIFIDFAEFEFYVRNAVPCGSISTYGRLFLPYLEGINKILYIDCDTVVIGRLRELYETDLTGYAVAGVQDIVALRIRKQVGLEYGERYINAGVSLMNLAYWRENDGTNKCLDFIEAYNGNVPFHDQGTINGVFRGHILIVPPKYNVMNSMLDFSGRQISTYMEVENYYSNKDIKDAQKHPAIIHFTAGFYTRPWYTESSHPYAGIYRKYKEKSPWCDESLTSGGAVSFYSKLNRQLRIHVPISLYVRVRTMIRKIRGYNPDLRN